MSVIGWIVLGLIAGWLGSKIMGTSSSQGMMMDIVLGIVGAVVGGFVFSLFGTAGVTGFNIWSLIVATIGAVIVIWLYHKFAGRPI
jgi:uncharacterized membrane protein YeaQ/YmgE (transglycosylase-associated protein family)